MTEMTEYPDVLTFIDTLKSQSLTAIMFDEFHPHKYKYSKKYIYSFDDDGENPLLWTETTKNDVIFTMSNFITKISKYHIMQTSTSVPQALEIKKVMQQSTRHMAMDGVYQYFLSIIGDAKFYERLNRTMPSFLPISKCKIIDLQTGETRIRNKSDNFSYFSDVRYTSKRSDTFMNFISSIMCDNKENLAYLQKMLGYCLTGHISARVFFIWWGVGANGKSMILNLMKGLMKDQCQSVSKCVFVSAQNSSSGGCETLQLKDCRLATFSETNAKDCLNESLIKMVTGNDSITARGLYKDPVTFTPICKLVLCTNHKPDFNGNDKANIDRVRFMPFSARFVDNPTKKNEYKRVPDIDKIIIEHHLSEFFSWCVDGAIEYYKNPHFNPPSEIKEQLDKYADEQSTITNFINETFEPCDGEFFEKKEIKCLYESYCKDNDMKVEKLSLVHDKLGEIYGESKQYGGGVLKGKRGYMGFKIRDYEDDVMVEVRNDCI